jgi:hypothetical protein
MDTIHIVNLHTIFAENAHCLSIRLGIDVVKDFNPISGHTYIIFAAHEQAPTLYSCQLALGKEGKPFKFIIINGEPPQSPHLRNKYYIELMRGNVVWDYHEKSATYLKSLGIRVYSQYVFEFLHNEGDPMASRPIDILFVGSRNERREALYKKMVERYPNKNIVFDMDWKHGDHNTLRKLLQSAKIVLNIPFYESGILETHRINSALSAGCQVVSLYSGHKETDAFYEPYIYFTHDLFETLDRWTKGRPPSRDAHWILLGDPRLGYPHLVNALNPTIQHNKWILKQLIKN